MDRYNPLFIEQVKLLLQCLPAIRAQNHFALKGGTALNLFVNNLPRLSVDIDLTYAHLHPREFSLNAMQQGLREMAQHIRNSLKVDVKEQYNKKEGYLIKLLVYTPAAMVKIEPNFVMRGTLLPIVQGQLCQKVNEDFSAAIDNIPMLAIPELYAGKLCAALNRQHPRDLFDVKLLFENNGITDEIRQVFVVYLACDVRPIHELLKPNLLDIKSMYQREFQQMSDRKISVDALLVVRQGLINTLNKTLTPNERQFLFSVKCAEPRYELMPYPHLQELPALQWKIMNVRRMDKAKQELMLNKLKDVLGL